MDLSDARELVLSELKGVGQRVAAMAEPSYWSFDQMNRAAKYKQMLEPLRTCYKRARSATTQHSLLGTLAYAKRIVGPSIEGNGIQRTIDMLKGIA
jgi:hypothetical protein